MNIQNAFISEGRDYSVPCIYSIKGPEKTVCVVVHGFGSNKESFTAKILLEEFPPLGIGVMAFDLPAHGESGVDGEFLRLTNCTADLAAAEALARTLAPEAEIVYFGSSFGAYITLIYLAGNKQGKHRAFLRSAAVSMPRLSTQFMTSEQMACLETTGEILLHAEEYGYTRNLKLTQGFFDDLKCHDVFSLWREGLAELRMIHGESDETVPLSDAKSFAEMFNVPLTVVPNGDHQLSVPGAPEKVLKLASEFFQ